MRRSTLLLCPLLLACSKPADAPGNDQRSSAANEAAIEAEKPMPAPPEPGSEPVVGAGDPAGDPKLDPSAAPDPALASAGPPRLLIANEEGLHEYDLDGKRLTTIAAGSASAPRVLADGRIVFLRAQPQLELWLHTPTGNLTKQVATLPQQWDPGKCQATPGTSETSEPLGLQAPRDFRLDEVKQEACISLQDRNDNMADVGVIVWVPLGGAELRQIVSLDLQGECAGEAASDSCYELPLERAPPPAAATEFAYGYDPETGKLSGPAGSLTSICRADGQASEGQCANVEDRSTSGRFELLSGEMDEGDYIYRELIVLDRQTGKLTAISSDYEAPKLVPVEVAEVFGGRHEGWLAIPGESDVRWLVEDRLWIDGLLINPDKATLVRVGGDLAFRLDQ